MKRSTHQISGFALKNRNITFVLDLCKTDFSDIAGKKYFQLFSRND